MVLPPDKRRGVAAKPPATPEAVLRDYARLGKLEFVAVDTVVPYANNARTQTDRGINLIMQSIQGNGFITPVLIDQHNNLIAGHGRIEAAKRLGLKEVPALRFDHLTPDQVRAYRIIDNRHAEMSGWNREMLAVEYQHLVEIDLGYNIHTIGFSMGEIDVMLDDPAAAEGDDDEGAVPDLSKPAVTRVSDVWLCGRHRVLCGSSLSSAAIKRVCAGKVIDISMERSTLEYCRKHDLGVGQDQAP